MVTDPPSSPESSLGPGARTTLRRQRDRGIHDASVVYAILDAAPICHVGFTAAPDGSEAYPVVLPMVHARLGDRLYLHGAPANAMLGVLATGTPVCVTATIVDGLVLARSMFHHSMNFRCVTVFGTAEIVDDADEIRAASGALVDHVVPGRAAITRPPTASEIRRTRFVAVPIVEASAKIRTGGPNDEPEDLDLEVWAGHVPVSSVAGAPVPDAGVAVSYPR